MVTKLIAKNHTVLTQIVLKERSISVVSQGYFKKKIKIMFFFCESLDSTQPLYGLFYN